jgi:hypothetical protein
MWQYGIIISNQNIRWSKSTVLDSNKHSNRGPPPFFGTTTTHPKYLILFFFFKSTCVKTVTVQEFFHIFSYTGISVVSKETGIDGVT